MPSYTENVINIILMFYKTQYREDNKEYIQQYNKQYYDKNKEKIIESILKMTKNVTMIIISKTIL